MKSKSLFSFIVTLFLIYGCSSNRQADGKSNILAKNDINIRGDFQNYVSTQFRASPFKRALFSALNRVLLIN